MTDYITLLSLTKKLMSLPSYVDISQDETSLTDFLAEFLAAALPEMMLEKQFIEGSSRCNLILRGKGEPKLFTLGHIDTVQPKVGWQTNPFVPTVKQDRLYGLGASDMKGSLAAFLWALIHEKQNIALDNLMLLMYVDEEYDFKGIKRFLKDRNVTKLRPAMTLSLDGELAVGTGCRGLIEINLFIKGKSGHAANPKNGVNAITQTITALQTLDQELRSFADPDLGPTTTNVAYLQGGVMQKEDNGEAKWLREGNVIPDTAEVILEVRPSVAQVSAEFVLHATERHMQKCGLQVASSTIRHDIAPWPVMYEKKSLGLLQGVYAKANIPFKKASRTFQGYIDAQMVAEKIKAPTFIIGTGGANKHGANENVPLKSLDQTAQLYRTLLKEILS